MSAIAVSEHEQADRLTQEGLKVIQQMIEYISRNPETPWSQPVIQARERARQIFLTVLFQFPSSPFAHNINNLWIQTTHTYLKSLSSAVNHAHNAVIAITPPGTQARGGQANKLWNARRQYRIVVQRDVEFYNGLIDRIVRFYKLHDLVQDSLDLVDIVVSERASEDGSGSAISEVERKDRTSLVYDTLIHLGDLERYRSQLDDRELAPNAMGPPSQLPPPKPAYGAEDHYLAALSLVRDNGHAYNSLAIVAEAEHLDSKAIYYYIRALIVRKPFKSAEAVLNTRFKKRLVDEEERQRGFYRNDPVPVPVQYLTMMAMLYRRQSLNKISDLNIHAAESLSLALAQKELPSADIVQLTISLIGIHAHARQCLSIVSRNHPSFQLLRDGYGLALAVLVSQFRTMCEVAFRELDMASEDRDHENALADDDDDTDTDHDNDLAARIPSVVRRLLPSLRIMSKWLKCNLDHLRRHVDRSDIGDIQGLWREYTALIELLAQTFPIYSLPSPMGPLEEDVEIRGFLPLAKASTSAKADDHTTDRYHAKNSDEEQLMRISDLSVEARLSLQQAVELRFVHQKTLDRLSLLHQQPEPRQPVPQGPSVAAHSALEVPSLRRDSEPSDEDDDEIIVFTPAGRQGPRADERASGSVAATNQSSVPAPVAAPPQVTAPTPLASVPPPGPAPFNPPPPMNAPQQRPMTAMDLLAQITRQCSVNGGPAFHAPATFGPSPAPPLGLPSGPYSRPYPAYGPGPSYPLHTAPTEGLYGAEATMWTLTREESEEGIRRSLSQSGQARSGQYQNQNNNNHSNSNSGITMNRVDSGPSLLRPNPSSAPSMSMSRSISHQLQSRPPIVPRTAPWPTSTLEALYTLAGRKVG